MPLIVTLTLTPSLDTATSTAKVYPEGKLRCQAPVFEPGGGGINVARAITHLGGQATALLPSGGPTGAHLVELLQQEGVTVDALQTHDWTRQNLHVVSDATGEQFRFVMPGAALHEDEWQQLLTKIAQLPAGTLLVLSGSLPPNMTTSAVTELLQCARQQGLRTIVDSSGDALKAAVAFGGLELLKPNQSELAELTGQSLEQPDQVVNAARSLISQGAAKRIVVSLGPQGALAVDAEQCIQVVPPPVIKRSTVGAGDSMVGAMVLKLAEDAPLADMVRFGVAAGTAATMNQGTKLCSKDDTEKLYQYLQQQ
ncbi:1-phosphofructokinase [Tolumonas auensis DSM 9187]|uniref:Phosphofructokinase n=1 Tax=Tolumonas auensis (strain DSM 9187 / NBRC 110442 / TA 4) TaxID=595494 RepID=C4L9D7_TOLAT|nr:6-phosphofructokinase II [Tolumonas auensis]ACQ92036.1 1-phosphofructokinase [Tolumonas auensis DSM 9187]